MTLIQVGSGTTSINVVKNTNNNITEFKLNSITITDDTITFNAKIIFNETTPTPAQKYYFKINTTQSPPPISYSVDSNNSVDFTIGSATTPSYTNDILSKQLTLNILDDDTKTPNKYNTYIINIPLYESFKKIINFDEVNLTYFSDTKYSISESDIPTLYNMKNGDEPYLYSYDGHIRVNNKDFYKGGKTDSVWSIASPQPFYYDNPIFDSDKWVFNNKTITFTMNSNPVNDIISHEATINNLPIENYTSAQGLHTIILKSTKTNYSFLLNKIENMLTSATINSEPFYDTTGDSNYYNYNLSLNYLTLKTIKINYTNLIQLLNLPSTTVQITDIQAFINNDAINASVNISPPINITADITTISQLDFKLVGIGINDVSCDFTITYSITINKIVYPYTTSILINNGNKIKNLLPTNFITNGYGFPSSTITLDNSTIDNFVPKVEGDTIFIEKLNIPFLFTVDFEYNTKTITTSNIINTGPNYILNFNTPIQNKHITQNITFNQDLVYETTIPYIVQFKSNDNNFLDLFNNSIQDIIDNATITTDSITVESKNYYNYNLSTDYLTLQNITITYKEDLPISNNISITNINASINSIGSNTYTTPLPLNISRNLVTIDHLNFLNPTGIGNNDNVCEITITYSINNSSTIISNPITINPINPIGNTASSQQFNTIGILSNALPPNFYTDGYGFKTADINLDNSTLNNFKPTVQGDSIFTPSSFNLFSSVNFLYNNKTSSSSTLQNNYTVTFTPQIPINYNIPLIQQITFIPDILNEKTIPPINKITNDNEDLLEKYIQEQKNIPILKNNNNISLYPEFFKGDINIEISDTSLLDKYSFNIYLHSSTQITETTPPSSLATKIYTGQKGDTPPSSITIPNKFIKTDYSYGKDLYMYIYIGYEIDSSTILYTLLSNSTKIDDTSIIEPPKINSVMNNNPLKGTLTGEINFDVPNPPSISQTDNYSIYCVFTKSNQPPTEPSGVIKIGDKLKGVLSSKVISILSSTTPPNLSYTDDDVYIYLVVGINNKSNTSIIYGDYSNSIIIPKISIKNPQQINYSNYWPYSFDMDAKTSKPIDFNYVSCGPVEIDYSNEDTKDLSGNSIYNGEGFIIYRGRSSTTSDTKLSPSSPSNLYNRISSMNYGSSIWIKKNDSDYPEHNFTKNDGTEIKTLIYSLSTVSSDNLNKSTSDPFSSSFDYNTFKPVRFPLPFDYENGGHLYYISEGKGLPYSTDYLHYPIAGVCKDLTSVFQCQSGTSTTPFVGLRLYDYSLIDTVDGAGNKIIDNISTNSNYRWYINLLDNAPASSVAPYLTISSKYNNAVNYSQSKAISVCSSSSSNQSWVGAGPNNNGLTIKYRPYSSITYTPLNLGQTNSNKSSFYSGNYTTIQLTNTIPLFKDNYLNIAAGGSADNCLGGTTFTKWDYIEYLPVVAPETSPKWVFINPSPTYSTVRMCVASWGYNRISINDNFNDIQNGIDNVKSSISTLFSLSIRDHATTIKGDLTPNFIIDDAIKSDYGQSTFTNYLNHSFGSNLEVNYINSSTNTSDNSPVILTSILITAISTTNINMNYNNLYMACIPTIKSILYKQIGTTSDPTKDTKIGDLSFTNLFQSLVQLFIGREKSPIFTINSAKLDTSLNYIPETNDILINNKLDIIQSPSKYYIRQEPLIPTSNTSTLPIPQTTQFGIDPTTKINILNKSITYIKGLEKTAIDSISGSGGNMKCIYIGKNKSDLTVIDNVIAIAGGGGGGGVYSQKDTIDDLDPIMNSLSAFNGRDGLGLNYKEGLNDNIKYKADLNNMNGGSIGCYASTTSYQINTSCLGGSVHTFKNEKTNAETNNWYYNNYGGRNNGFYPQIHDTTTDIISVKINGYSYIDAPIYYIKYNKTSYFVDSGGLKKTAANEFGNGGSADNSNVLQIKVNQWGAQDGIVNFGTSVSKNGWNNNSTPLYSRGGGGGGGFGGGSAGGYFYFETFTEKDISSQKLSNIPPGGGGGGNSFYNKKIHGGNAYGFEKGTTTLLSKVKDEPMPSLLSQLLKLSRPDIVKSIKTISSYSNGTDQSSYIYLY